MPPEGLDLLPEHHHLVVFAWAFLAQLGLPVPALPMLLGAGALAGLGHMSLALAVATATGATLLADTIWYTVGRARGDRILGLLARFSLVQEVSIGRAKHTFLTHRVRCLIVAKFLPGLNPIAASLAGISAISPVEFLCCNAAGAVLWAAAWMTIGYFCADLTGAIVHGAGRLGAPLLGAVGTAIVACLVFRHMRRRQRSPLREPRLVADDLMPRLDARAPTDVIDLRTALDVAADPVRIPGAQLIGPDERGFRWRD